MDYRAILHVDMDAFYASVEELDDPTLRGKPVIVGGTQGRGVVAAASYAVRRYGVRSAMPIRAALRLCPDAILVPPRMARYRAISVQVFGIFHELTPLVEGLSLDEAFLDVTASRRLFGDAVEIGAQVRSRIRSQTGLTASVGVATNKLVAKIASDLNKPDGLCSIGSDNLRAVLDPLPIQRLWGIGPKTLPAVAAAGIRCFGDLRAASEQTLWRLFGKHANAMRDRACGIDERPVTPDRDEKSISAECTFAADIRDPRALRTELSRLADRAAARLRAASLATRLVAIKVRRADFATYSRQRAFAPATQDTGAVARIAADLLSVWASAHPGAPVRLLGVRLADLGEAGEPELFEPRDPRESKLDAAVDEVRRRFGPALLTRADHLRAAPCNPRPRRRPA